MYIDSPHGKTSVDWQVKAVLGATLSSNASNGAKKMEVTATGGRVGHSIPWWFFQDSALRCNLGACEGMYNILHCLHVNTMMCAADVHRSRAQQAKPTSLFASTYVCMHACTAARLAYTISACCVQHSLLCFVSAKVFLAGHQVQL